MKYLLGIRVVDPAMGSGHFLVSAVDEITNWIVDVLKECPDAPLAAKIKLDRAQILDEQKKNKIRLNTSLLSEVIVLKRMVMKRCVYGVDSNYLAVELAKLSLWLDSFTIGTPLTFLDHHIRCGDSLIGLWLEGISKRTGNDTLETWMETVSLTGSGVMQMVSMLTDLTKQEVEQSRKAYFKSRERMNSYQVVLDIITASMMDGTIGKKLPANLSLVEKTARELESSSAKKEPDWWANVEKAVSFARRFKAFHWEIEFPDAFRVGSDETERGFDLLLTNPPWDAVKPDIDDFFTIYYPKFRKIKKKEDKTKIIDSLLRKEDISKAWDEYNDSIGKKLSFFKQSEQYRKQGSGDTNLWKLFLERNNTLLKTNTGTLAILLPSSVVIDEGAKPLREQLFSENIRLLYEFENTNGIFPDVDSRTKFCLLVTERGSSTPTFPAAFYLHDVHSLEGKAEEEKFVQIPISLIFVCAPDSLSIPEVRNNSQLRVFSELYARHSLLVDDHRKNWNVSLLTELHRTADNKLFNPSGKGWDLIEGKNFHQFLPDFEKPAFVVEPKAGLERTMRHRDYSYINESIHKNPRLAFRSVASSTNVRSVIACVLPPHSFSPHNATIVLPRIEDAFLKPDGEDYARLVCYLTGILNSFIFDFLTRTRISGNLSFYYIYQTPVPAQYLTGNGARITELSARLCCPDERFQKFGNLIGINPKKLDMKERIELTAELNALIAEHYGMTKEDFGIVLGSFDGFEEDKNLPNLYKNNEIIWEDELVRKFNGEVRKLALQKFESLPKVKV